MPIISVHDLMTMCGVLLLLIGQNDIKTKLLQPNVVSICNDMTVEKHSVAYPTLILNTKNENYMEVL